MESVSAAKKRIQFSKVHKQLARRSRSSRTADCRHICSLLLVLLLRLLRHARQQPCSRPFGPHDGQAAARKSSRYALAG